MYNCFFYVRWDLLHIFSKGNINYKTLRGRRVGVLSMGTAAWRQEGIIIKATVTCCASPPNNNNTPVISLCRQLQQPKFIDFTYSCTMSSHWCLFKCLFIWSVLISYSCYKKHGDWQLSPSFSFCTVHSTVCQYFWRPCLGWVWTAQPFYLWKSMRRGLMINPTCLTS